VVVVPLPLNSCRTFSWAVTGKQATTIPKKNHEERRRTG
jgi:hypothetical protein